MARIVVLDAGPLGLASNAPGKPETDRCLAWLQGLADAGVRVVVPEVADYEVRRELLRTGATAGVRRLDRLLGALEYERITTTAMCRAAELWALVRQAGLPTADPKALDGDVILAAQAKLLGGEEDEVIIATTNVGHLGRFADARPWDQVGPGLPGAAREEDEPARETVISVHRGDDQGGVVRSEGVLQARVTLPFEGTAAIQPVVMLEFLTADRRDAYELVMTPGAASELARRLLEVVERAGGAPG